MQTQKLVLTELIEAFLADPVPGADKRTAERTALHINVDVTLLNGPQQGRTYTAVTRDLSTSGISVFQSQQLETGQQLQIKLSNPKGGLLKLQCTAMHCVRACDGIFIVGARIDTLQIADVKQNRSAGQGRSPVRAAS